VPLGSEPEQSPFAPQMFGNAGREHMERYGTRAESFARIAVKNHRHSIHNPKAQLQREYSLEEVLASPLMYAPLTRLQCCPTSSGAGAALLASADFVRRHRLESRAVEIRAQAMATDEPGSFKSKEVSKLGAIEQIEHAPRRQVDARRQSIPVCRPERGDAAHVKPFFEIDGEGAARRR